jgi:hypothetical protein
MNLPEPQGRRWNRYALAQDDLNSCLKGNPRSRCAAPGDDLPVGWLLVARLQAAASGDRRSGFAARLSSGVPDEESRPRRVGQVLDGRSTARESDPGR